MAQDTINFAKQIDGRTWAMPKTVFYSATWDLPTANTCGHLTEVLS